MTIKKDKRTGKVWKLPSPLEEKKPLKDGAVVRKQIKAG